MTSPGLAPGFLYCIQVARRISASAASLATPRDCRTSGTLACIGLSAKFPARS